MIDLERTWELPHAAIWPKGVSRVSSLPQPARYRPAAVGVDMAKGPDRTAFYTTSRDPVVQAALAMMADGHDRLAIVMTLADHYPGRCIKEVDRVVRETAVTLVAAGIIPTGHTAAPV